MNNVNSLISPLRDLWNRASTSSGPSPSQPLAGPSATTGTTTAAPTAERAAQDGALEGMRLPSIDIPAVVARMDPVATKLDQLKTTASGPYDVAGTIVSAPAQFRMQGGYNQPNVNKENALLAHVASRVGLVSELPALQEGRGDPKSLVKLTQALIDDDQLEPGSTKPLADQIHDLQWRFGIGIDCAGYVHRAISAAFGDPTKLGLKPSGFENFTGIARNSHFTSVDPTEARTGDVLVLGGNGTTHDPGHNLIVRSRSTLNVAAETISSRWPGATSFLQNAASPVHVYEVDSSFGAGALGAQSGGVRRDLLLYDTASKQWCACKDTRPPEVLTASVPYAEHALTGFFRPKVATQ